MPNPPPSRPAASPLRARFAPASLVFGLIFLLSQATRVVLLALRPQLLRDGLWPLAKAFAAGAAIDLLATAWIVLPWVIYLALAPERWLRTRVQRVLLFASLAAAIYGALFVTFAEGFFFDEFESRFNFVAVDYLLYPTEVLTNIWESYPTGWILGGIAVATAAILWARRRAVSGAAAGSVAIRARLGVLGVFLVAIAGCTLLLPAQLTVVSDDRALNQVAGNGYASFLAALLGADVPYEGFYRTLPRAEVLARLPGLLADSESAAATFDPGTSRRVVRPAGPPRRLNVVVVLEESLGSEFIGALRPQAKSITPELDRLIPEGTLLANAFSTGNRTIRAIEATTSGLPPLPGESVVRRPTSIGLFTLPAVLGARGYRTLFVYGGRAMFDGMGRYLAANGVERIVEQRDFPDDAFATAWGVCDGEIFRRAIAEMDAFESRGERFYLLALTTSNHRPFQFPESEVAWDHALDRRHNAVHYADHALGRFIDEARRHAFFDHTLFVLMGDHGARVYGAGEIPLPSYEVPILFFAPGIVPAGGRYERMASSLDIPPTVLGILGEPYVSRFFGHDLFSGSAPARALMEHNHKVALLSGDRMAMLSLQRGADTFRVTSDTAPMQALPAADPQGRALLADAIAYYQGGDWLYRSGAYLLAPGDGPAGVPAPPAAQAAAPGGGE